MGCDNIVVASRRIGDGRLFVKGSSFANTLPVKKTNPLTVNLLDMFLAITVLGFASVTHFVTWVSASVFVAIRHWGSL